MHFFMILGALVFAQMTIAVSPVVHLNYTSYRGTALPNGVSQWLGMRFAAPPLGDLRFRAPQDPLLKRAILDADIPGPACLGTNQGPPTDEMDEDCLFLNVFAPSLSSEQSLLPVYFFIPGGGFNSLGYPGFNGSGLIIASEMNIVVVTINYRVGLYGFLAGREILAGGSLNNGLKDQRKALEWVQAYISLFGGNPDHVTIAGQSAGAQSVNLHVTAYGGRDDGLFHGTAAESQSFSALRTISESQFVYDNLVIRTGCAKEEDTLACLRSLNATALQQQNYNTPFPGAQNPPLFMYGPVLDFDFVSDYTYSAYASGSFIPGEFYLWKSASGADLERRYFWASKGNMCEDSNISLVPAIAGANTNGGTIFAPMNTSSIGDSDSFVKDQFPAISLAEIRRVNQLYPVNSTRKFPDSGRYWRQASKGYGDMRYMCPGLFISATQANSSIPTWNYRYNVIDPELAEEGYGVEHSAELNAIWGPENTNNETSPYSYYPGGVNSAIVPVMQAYWTSFIRTFDPNTYRLHGSPRWEEWTVDYNFRRLMIQTNQTSMEGVGIEQREKCDFFQSIGVAIGQ